MTSGKAVITTRNQWDRLPPGGFGNVTWGREGRELTLDCQGCQGNDASIIYVPGFPLLDHWNPLFNLRPELKSNMHLAFT